MHSLGGTRVPADHPHAALGELDGPVKGSDQLAHLVERLNAIESSTDLVAGGEPLQVPAGVLAKVTYAAGLVHPCAEEFGMFDHAIEYLAEIWTGIELFAIEGGGKVTEEPRAAKTAPTNHDAIGTRGAHHAHCIVGLPDVTVAQHRDVQDLNQPADSVPVRLARIQLCGRARVEPHRRGPLCGGGELCASSLVDLQTLAMRPGEDTPSLRRVCSRTIGLRLDKTQQCSDWARRPLEQEQLVYATLDAHILLQVYEALLARE